MELYIVIVSNFENQESFRKKAEKYHNELKKKIEAEKKNIKFRTVACIGRLKLFRIPIRIRTNCPLYEWIGKDLSELIKKSKEVSDFYFCPIL
ncbi:MAG: hypothetical protein DSY42_01405 [Aquifex sp.]|nr:MAG: hypothetical protein DSY42_01405 [Aquifex sp.]